MSLAEFSNVLLSSYSRISFEVVLIIRYELDYGVNEQLETVNSDIQLLNADHAVRIPYSVFSAENDSELYTSLFCLYSWRHRQKLHLQHAIGQYLFTESNYPWYGVAARLHALGRR